MAGSDQNPIDFPLPEPNYSSYLVRCWKEAGTGSEDEPAWRFLLVDIKNQQHRKVFASLDDLACYLRQTLESWDKHESGTGEGTHVQHLKKKTYSTGRSKS